MTMINSDMAVALQFGSTVSLTRDVRLFIFKGDQPDAAELESYINDGIYAGAVDVAALMAARGSDLLLHQSYPGMKPSVDVRGIFNWVFSERSEEMIHVGENFSTWFVLAVGFNMTEYNTGYSFLTYIGDIGDDESDADLKILDVDVINEKDYKISDLEVSIV